MYDLSSKEFGENDVLVMGSDGLWEQFQNTDVSAELFACHNTIKAFCSSPIIKHSLNNSTISFCFILI